MPILGELAGTVGFGPAPVSCAPSCLPTRPPLRFVVGHDRGSTPEPEASGRFVRALQALTALTSTRQQNARLRAQAQARQASSQSSFPDSLGENLRLQKLSHLQDLLHCLFLAEGTYKIIDHEPEVATELTAGLMEGFSPELICLQSISWSLPSVNHRYLLSETKDTLYVAFMGTKQRRDLIANANVIQEPVWPAADSAVSALKAVPAAHKGFLNRAATIPVESLYQHASSLNKRLVLTGHSLGAAVAVLSTLRLLKQLPKGSSPRVMCLTFACPAVGNASLADMTKANGWQRFFRNHLVPEDIVPRLLAPPEGVPTDTAMLLQRAAAGLAAESSPPPAMPLAPLPWQRPGAKRKRQDTEKAVSNSLIEETLTAPHLRKRHAKGAVKLQASSSPYASRPGSQLAMKAASNVAVDVPAGQDTSLPAGQKQGRASWQLHAPSLQSLQGQAGSAAAYGARIAGAPGRALAALRERASLSQPPVAEGAASAEDQRVNGLVLHCMPSSPDEQDSTQGRAPMEHPGAFARLRIPPETAQGAPPQRTAQQGRLGGLADAAGGVVAVNIIVSATASSSVDGDEGDASLQDGDMASLLMGIRAQWEQQQQQQAPSQQSSEPTAPALSALDTPDTAPNPRSPPTQSPAGSSSPLSSTLHLDRPASEISFDAEPTAVSRSSGFRPGPRALASSAGMLLSRTAGAGVRTAGAGVRTAARLVGTPLAAARRRYFPIGKQFYIFPTAVAPVAADAALLPSAADVSLQSLQLDEDDSADPSVNRNPLKRAAGMHRMAYHRRRIRIILGKALQEAQAPGQLSTLLTDAQRTRRANGITHSEHKLTVANRSPAMHVRRAETFIPWKLPGSADVKQMLDDLGSLSEQGMAPESPVRGAERWKWLRPWAWVSGLAWKQGASKAPLVELMLHIHGSGLETCRSVQVRSSGMARPCSAQVLHRPQPLPPATSYALLGSGQTQLLRQVTLAGLWSLGMLNRSLSAVDRTVDRTSASGHEDAILAKVQVPAASLQSAALACLENGHAECEGLEVILQSDFREVSVPLHLHSGASWMVSDFKAGAKSLLDWMQ